MVVAVVLALVALLGLTTDTFVPPRTVVADALGSILEPSDSELRLIYDLRAKPDRKRKRTTHIQIRGGPGAFVRVGGEFPRIFLPLHIILDRPGARLTIRGEGVSKEGAVFLRFTEMPHFNDTIDRLRNRWLQIGDRRARPDRVLADAERDRLLTILTDGSVLTSVHRGRREQVRSVRARAYDLVVDDTRLTEALAALPSDIPGHQGLAGLSAFLHSQLSRYRVGLIRLWITPRDHNLVRTRVELFPRGTSTAIERIVLDATVLPRTVAEAPDIPARATRIHLRALEQFFAE